MVYRSFVSLNIAIIGTSAICQHYAQAYVRAGHRVFIAGKDSDSSSIDPLLELDENVHLCTIQESAAQADFIVIATDAADVREVAYWLGDVRRKVIVDVTLNVLADPTGQNTVSAIKAITGSPHIIKCFNTRGCEKMLQPLLKTDKRSLILAGDSKKAKEMTKILSSQLGIENCYDFGNSETIPLLDAMASVWRSMELVKKKPHMLKVM